MRGPSNHTLITHWTTTHITITRITHITRIARITHIDVLLDRITTSAMVFVDNGCNDIIDFDALDSTATGTNFFIIDYEKAMRTNTRTTPLTFSLAQTGNTYNRLAITTNITFPRFLCAMLAIRGLGHIISCRSLFAVRHVEGTGKLLGKFLESNWIFVNISGS
jgi:hypothetical protein